MTTTTVQPIDRVLDKLRYTGQRPLANYKCLCPAHDDGNESLSVKEADNGKVLLKCFAGCSAEKIVAAVGLRMADLMPPHKQATRDKRKLGPIVREYNYTDADGKLLFQATRHVPKDFRQRHPDPNGKNGWSWDLKGVELVPYNLVLLRQATPYDWVFVVEGEKDVENLRCGGGDIIATCNPMGAGKWRDSYNQYFTGLRVCILPDNDEPGRSHAEQVARSLVGVAAEVRIVELPGLPEKGDVSDWLGDALNACDHDNGETLAARIEELHELVEAAPIYIAPLPSSPPEHFNGNAAHPAEQAGEKVGKATAIRDALAEMGYTFRLNLIRERIERPDGSSLHDGEQAAIIANLFDRGLSNKALMMDVMLADAWDHRYDPLKDFLEGLVWDGQDHIRKLSYYFEDAHLLIDYPDGRKSTVFAAWLRRWLIGAAGKVVARVQNPMLVLASEQGIGKSEFARWICSPMPDYFVENAINPEAVDHQRWAAGNFIWEVGELGATTRKADVEALKAFITRHEHSFRVPYAKNEVHKAARASFLGTVNPDNAGFLTDPTGNRRFLTVEVTVINWRGYMAEIDVRQVWAQAYALYKQDPDSWKLDETETAVRDGINGEFNVDDPVRDAILSLFDVIPNASAEDGVSFTSSADLVFHVGTQVRAVSTKALQMDVSRAMKRLNVTKVKRNNVNGFFGVSKRPASNLLPTYND